MLIKVAQGMEEKIHKELVEMAEIEDIHQLFGSYQYIMEVCGNHESVTRKLRGMNGISKCKWLNGC